MAIEIVHLPIDSMVIFQFAMFNYQRVSYGCLKACIPQLRPLKMFFLSVPIPQSILNSEVQYLLPPLPPLPPRLSPRNQSNLMDPDWSAAPAWMCKMIKSRAAAVTNLGIHSRKFIQSSSTFQYPKFTKNSFVQLRLLCKDDQHLCFPVPSLFVHARACPRNMFPA